MDERQKNRLLLRAKMAAMTIAGLTMVLTPLALWAAPNLTAFYASLLTCATAYAAYLLLSQIGPEEPVPAVRRDDKVALSPQLIDLLQDQRELSRSKLPELRRFVQDNIRPKTSDQD